MDKDFKLVDAIREMVGLGFVSNAILEQIRAADDEKLEVVLHILNGDLDPDLPILRKAITGEARLVTTEDCEKIHAWLDAKLQWSLRDEKIRFGPQVGQDQGG